MEHQQSAPQLTSLVKPCGSLIFMVGPDEFVLEYTNTELAYHNAVVPLSSANPAYAGWYDLNIICGLLMLLYRLSGDRN